MGQTYKEWAEGHWKRGYEEGLKLGFLEGVAMVKGGREMLLRVASRRFGARAGRQLEERTGWMGWKQLGRLADAIGDCDTADEVLAVVDELLAVAGNGSPDKP